MEALVNGQIENCNQIGNAYKNYKKSPKIRITKPYVEVRIQTLEQKWNKFATAHDQLMSMYSDELKENQYVTQTVYEVTEELYMDYLVELKTALESFEHLTPELKPKVIQGNTESGLTTACIKLPKIVIPIFSGLYTEWVTFRDLFESLVHNNKSLDNVQKMHYLKGYLCGEAEQLLRQIPISGQNYTKCWDLLKERYNNKKYICNTILKRFLSQRNAVTESATYLKELIDTSSDCLSALSNLGIDVSTWDVMVIHLLTLKLDPETRKAWELSAADTGTSDILPTFQQFREFLTNRFRALEFIENKKPVYNNNQTFNQNKPRVLHAMQSTQCPCCTDNHKLTFCKQFGTFDVDTRRNFVQEKGLCFNCLGSNHSAKFCQNPATCRTCKRRHHTMIHQTSGMEPNTSGFKTSNVGVKGEETSPIMSCFSAGASQVLLATAIINAQSKSGQYYQIRALLDQGSQASFVTEATVQYLGLKRENSSGRVTGLGGENNVVSRGVVTINLQSLIHPDIRITVRAYILKTVTAFLPSKSIADLNGLDMVGMRLADPNYDTPNKIDILLGAEVYSRIIQEGMKKNYEGTLVAQATTFGWILSGMVETSKQLTSNVVVLHSQVNEDNILKRFWELEADPAYNQKWLTVEEEQCEALFAANTTRDDEGRYVVRLPFKDEDPSCKYGHLRAISEKRFYSLENRLNKDKELKAKYKEVIDEYEKLGHMEVVSENEKNYAGVVYLPHHAIVKPDRDTTKVRVVFDASCRGTNGVSLNENLMIGPRLQPDLRHIILRWRLHPICLISDIVKMYRQVKVHQEDADFQRLLWRDNPEDELKHYRLLRVTFGTAAAPYLAVKALQQVAIDDGDKYPMASSRVLKDFYMDDLMSGCDSVEEGVQIFREMNELLNKAGFELQKWSSNNEMLLQDIREGKEDEDDGRKLEIKLDSVIKILGLTWNRGHDEFQYSVKLPPMKEPATKRNIIADIARLFDPLGWIAPCVILAKAMIQKLWLTGIGWDEEVPSNLLHEWTTYRKELSLLTQIQIPRWLSTDRNNKIVELHGFCDASKIAYAAVIYVRVVTDQGNVIVTLLTAKTKVAPIKQVSIPRLELCGAVLLTRLLAETSQIINIKKQNIHAWTDSTVVLAWLNSHPSRWQTFVANRVSEVLTTLDSNQWSHVVSKQNPADCASRGVRPSELLNTGIWLNGPEFLKEENIQYTKLKENNTDLEVAKVHHITLDTSLWEKYSTLTRLVRVVAYCRRFLNMKKPAADRNHTNHLTGIEVREAMSTCIRQCQRECFGQEYEALENDETNLPKKSAIKSLNPFLDHFGMMRIGGRLENANMNFGSKHPILLPKKSRLTDLVVADAHVKTCHGANQLMHNYLNSRYWIFGVKELIRKHIRKCVTCVRYKATTQTQLMGQLPSARVTPTRPFKFSGVDYAGPINLRTTSGRGHKSYKGYIALFVCMSTRALHIEVVSNLTSQGFIQAFRRMVARRGYCQEIWSDNGTNFVGAAKELKNLFKSERSRILKEIADELATNGTMWHFIPAHAPNFGGLWEAGVKSVKHHLRRVIGDTTLTFEEMTTVLSQIESCLNSRPLSRMDMDPTNTNVLTPGHFLVGEPLITLPDQEYLDRRINSLRRWQLTQRMVQEFWKRWSQEYLNKFLQRYKWTDQNPEPSIGDIVLVKEDDLPPSRWLLGKVLEKHPGKDGITRVVTLKIRNNCIKRPTNKLCVLPVTD